MLIPKAKPVVNATVLEEFRQLYWHNPTRLPILLKRSYARLCAADIGRAGVARSLVRRASLCGLRIRSASTLVEWDTAVHARRLEAGVPSFELPGLPTYLSLFSIGEYFVQQRFDVGLVRQALVFSLLSGQSQICCGNP